MSRLTGLTMDAAGPMDGLTRQRSLGNRAAAVSHSAHRHHRAAVVQRRFAPITMP